MNVLDQIKWHTQIVSGIIANGTKAVFKCRWWSKDVEVEMMSPYCGEKETAHMIFMSPMRYGEESGCIDWQDVAWRLVRKIVIREDWKKCHREAYERRREESRHVRDEIYGEIEKLKDSLSKVRKTRIGGWCGSLQYGSKIEKIKKEIREWELLAMQEEEWYWLPEFMKNYNDDKR